MADETIEIGVKVNGEKSLKDLKKEVDSAGKSTQNLNKEMKGLDSTFEDVYGDLKPMSSRLGEIEDRMYELANANQTSSKEFQVLQKEAIKFRKTIRSVDTAVDSAAEGGTKLNNALAISSSVVAGYQGFASVQALVGQESEELMETMVKLQAAEGALQSIQQIRYTLQQNQVALNRALTATQTAYTTVVGTSTGALKAFRLALVATGIGAIVVLVGALVTKWDDFTEALGFASAEQEIMNDAMVEGVKSASKELQSLDELTKSINTNGKSRTDVVNEIKQFKQEHPEMLKNLNEEEATMDDLNKAIEDQSRLVKILAIEKALAAKTEELYKDMIEEQMQMMTEQNKGWRENIIDLSGWVNGMGNVVDTQALANQRTQENISSINQQIDAIANMRKMLMGQAEDLGHVNDKYADEKREKYLEMLEDEEEQQNKNTTALRNYISEYDRLIERINKFIEGERTVAELFRIDEEILQSELDKGLISLETFLQRRNELFDMYNIDEQFLGIAEGDMEKIPTRVATTIENTQKKTVQSLNNTGKVADEVTMATVSNMTSQYADTLGTIAGLFEQGSAAQKAFALASIVTDTASSLMKSVPVALEAATATGPAAPFVFAGTLAGIIGTVVGAAANAKQVLSSAPGPGGSGGGGGSISRPTLGGSAQRASEQDANVTNMFGSPNMGSEGTSDQFNSVERPQAQKVYVLQSEIAEANGEIASVEENSSL